MFKKNNKPLVRFVSTTAGLSNIEDCRPKPAKAFIPDWWKKTPANDISVKICPSFPDLLSQGFVLPMWTDTKIHYDKQTDRWSANSSSKYIDDWKIHSSGQFIDYVTPNYLGKEGDIVFKAISPWRIITPPGYSVMQLPLFYHFDKKYTILPGIIDTDIFHEANPQVLYLGNGEEITIKRGEGLALYVPFKRTKYDLSVEELTEETQKIFRKNDLALSTNFMGSGNYRKLQRERDARLAK